MSEPISIQQKQLQKHYLWQRKVIKCYAWKNYQVYLANDLSVHLRIAMRHITPFLSFGE